MSQSMKTDQCQYFESKNDVLQAIRLRHDIIHRDGFTKAGDLIDIEPATIKSTADLIRALVQTVDQQLIERYAQ